MKWIEPLERYLEMIVILWLFDTVFNATVSFANGENDRRRR